MLNKTITRRQATKLGAGGLAAAIATPALGLSAKAIGAAQTQTYEVQGGEILHALVDTINSTAESIQATSTHLHKAAVAHDPKQAASLQQLNLQQSAKIRKIAGELAHLKPQTAHQAKSRDQALSVARDHLAYV